MTARWYVVHVYSGFEKKVAQSIREQAEQKGLAEKFEEVLVPTEEVVEVQARRQGERRAQVLPRLRAGEDGPDRRDLASGQEHAEGDRASSAARAGRCRSPRPRRRAS